MFSYDVWVCIKIGIIWEWMGSLYDLRESNQDLGSGV